MERLLCLPLAAVYAESEGLSQAWAQEGSHKIPEVQKGSGGTADRPIPHPQGSATEAGRQVAAVQGRPASVTSVGRGMP